MSWEETSNVLPGGQKKKHVKAKVDDLSGRASEQDR
jgi:hypothetical protein